MNNDRFTEDNYELALIELFQRLGYQYECGYEVERDFRQPCLPPRHSSSSVDVRGTESR